MVQIAFGCVESAGTALAEPDMCTTKSANLSLEVIRLGAAEPSRGRAREPRSESKGAVTACFPSS